MPRKIFINTLDAFWNGDYSLYKKIQRLGSILLIISMMRKWNLLWHLHYLHRWWAIEDVWNIPAGRFIMIATECETHSQYQEWHCQPIKNITIFSVFKDLQKVIRARIYLSSNSSTQLWKLHWRINFENLNYLTISFTAAYKSDSDFHMYISFSS